MLTSALLAVVLAAPCPPQGTVIVVPDIGKLGIGFVMEVSGSTIDQRFSSLVDSRIERALPEGGKIAITIDRVVADAHAPVGTGLRILANVTVELDSAECARRSRATLFMGAKLKVTTSSGQPPALEIEPIPDSLVVTDDSIQAADVERAIRETGPRIARKLAVSIPLEGLDALVHVCPETTAATARAYDLGFAWVLQVAGPSAPQCGRAPEVFLQGDLFTLVLTRDMVRRLAASEYAAGHFPARMNEQGLVDPNGSVRVTGIRADIEPDTLLVDWQGRVDSRQVLIRWRLAFVSTAAGLALQINEITVDGMPRPAPKGGVINPVDDLMKAIAIGPKRTGLLTSPVGRMRLTTGRITAEALLVAGRV